MVDSEDLPLNISRETLQQNKIMRVIRKHLVKKALEMFEELADAGGEDYAKFLAAFGKNLKLGVHEDSVHRERLAKLLRFRSSTSEGEESVGLSDYVERMPEGQSVIYYLTGESLEAVAESPFVERLKAQQREVLYMVDPIDEYAVQQLREFDGKKLVCVSKEGLALDDPDDEAAKAAFEAAKAAHAPLCEAIKETLGDKVSKVALSQRIVGSPCVLVTGEYGWSANMERIMKAQALRADHGGMMGGGGQRTLEINGEHRIVRALKARFEADEVSDKTVRDLIWLLYETSLLTSGFTLDAPTKFAGRIHRLVELGLSLDDDEDEDDEEDSVVDVAADKEGGGEDDDEEESTMELVD